MEMMEAGGPGCFLAVHLSSIVTEIICKKATAHLGTLRVSWDQASKPRPQSNWRSGPGLTPLLPAQT